MMSAYKYQNGNRAFFVKWEGFKMFTQGPLRVYDGDQELGQINSMDELKAGREFSLEDGGSIRVSYHKLFWFIWVIKLSHNGQDVKVEQVLNK